MNIVITGASTGIGFEILQSVANEKNKICTLSRTIEPIQNFIDKSQLNESVLALKNDFADTQSISKIYEKIIAYLNYSIDVLILNAGIITVKPIENYSISEIENLFNVNTISPILLTQKLSPYLGKTSRGHIVSIGSMGGYQGSVKFAGLSIYSASKGALSIFTECIAEELKDRNISCNCLCLGAVQTQMLAKAFPDYQAPVNANEMGKWIAQFALTGQYFFNGKIIPISLSTP